MSRNSTNPEQVEARVRPARRRVHRPLIAAAALVIAGWSLWFGIPNVETLVDGSRSALLRGDAALAYDQAIRILRRHPLHKEALLLAGRSAEDLGQLEQAVEHWDQIPDDGSSEAIEARFATGELLLREGRRLSAAESQFRRVLAQDGSHALAHDRLVYLLGVQTRGWEMIPHQVELIRLGMPVPRRLYLLSLGERLPPDREVVKNFHDSSADDPGLRLALASMALADGDGARAERLLRSIVTDRPDLVEAHVRLGELVSDSPSESAVSAWHAALPSAAEDHPGVWAVRGALARRQHEGWAAARSFWEVLRRDPNHLQANYQLGQLLVSLDREELAEPFLRRAEALQGYMNSVYVLIARIEATSPRPAELRRLSESAESLGLLWEAAGWALIAQSSGVRAQTWVDHALPRLQSCLDRMPRARTHPDTSPAATIDLSEHAWHTELLGSPSDRTKRSLAADGSNRGSGPRVSSRVRFEDRAASAGLNFTYDTGGEPLKGLTRVYELTGGGVGILDFDGDGWPDIYLTQGGHSPADGGPAPSLDQLYRNLGDGRFQAVAVQAGLVGDGYGQGVAVGDFDNDGFPDLYVGNLGGNRLYRNNGDGTFSDVTDAAGCGGSRWTTSCLIADLNGNGLPDLYAVNYLEGSDVLTRVCRNDSGVLRSCLPQHFPASQDQIYLNLGDGRFEDVTDTAGIRMAGGKGLGIVAADFDGSGRLSLFVANDAVPNFYFVNETASPGGPLRLVERGLAGGLALNVAGRSEACMGIAAGDADGDGALDLFVTNFTEESNTLYRQYAPHLFADVTRESNLSAPSMRMLGFGTQFLDGALDGGLDLIVANGHVDDYRQAGLEYQMPPQYFQNDGRGAFIEVPGSQVGPYFEGRYLGRGLARLDWNRDGREDVVVSHLDAPAALLTNVTEHAGRFLALHLRGVTSARDAIGATVTLTSGERTLVRQLTAGDGYQASNQRLLVFGLESREHVDRLHVRWHAGAVQEFQRLPVNSEFMLIEGRPPVPLSAVSPGRD